MAAITVEFKQELPPVVLKILHTLRSASHEAYLVGGCVRDLVTGVEPKDYDIVTSAWPEDIKALFVHTIPVGISFGVLIVIEEGRKFEVATFRADGTYLDGRRPKEVYFATAEEDVRRRDFTINGLLFDPVKGMVYDYVGGMEDIKRRLVRTIGEPNLRFSEDRLRMLRAVRLAANLGYEIEEETFKAIQYRAREIKDISAERIRDELTKLLVRGGARRGMELLAETGLLAEILPEVVALRGIEQPSRFHPEGDVWEHTLRMLSFLEKDGMIDHRLAWGIIMHDLGKAVTRSEDERGIHFYGHVRKGEELAQKIMDRLRFSREEREIIGSLIHHHMRFMNVHLMRPNRLKRFLRMDNFHLHLALHRLDCLGSHGMLENYEFCLTKLKELSQEDLRPPPLITGYDLIALGYKPGPLFGRILRAVEDAQLNGEIKSPEEARNFVLQSFGK